MKRIGIIAAMKEEMEQIKDTPVSELLSEQTPADYFDKSLQEDKVDTINDVVSKCIDKFSEKFKDFEESCDYIAKVSNGGMRHAIACLDKVADYSESISDHTKETLEGI